MAKEWGRDGVSDGTEGRGGAGWEIRQEEIHNPELSWTKSLYVVIGRECVGLRVFMRGGMEGRGGTKKRR